jgi:hypothetical protein
MLFGHREVVMMRCPLRGAWRWSDPGALHRACGGHRQVARSCPSLGLSVFGQGAHGMGMLGAVPPQGDAADKPGFVVELSLESASGSNDRFTFCSFGVGAVRRRGRGPGQVARLAGVVVRLSLVGVEESKGIWWMPWRQEAMKDVARCEKLGGAASRL